MAKIKSVATTKNGKVAVVITRDRKIAIDTIRKEYGVKTRQIISAHSECEFSTHSYYYVVFWRNA